MPACCQVLGWKFIKCKITQIDTIKQEIISNSNDFDFDFKSETKNDDTNSTNNTKSDGDLIRIKYDLLCIDIGSTNIGKDLAGINQHAICTRPLKLLMNKVINKQKEIVSKVRLKIESKLVKMDKEMEKFDNNDNSGGSSEKKEDFDLEKVEIIRVIVVGGGCAGCELAMGLQHRLTQSLTAMCDELKQQRKEKTKEKAKEKENEMLDKLWAFKIETKIVTNGKSILPSEPRALRIRVNRVLKQRNIEIICNEKVVSAVNKGEIILASEKKMYYDALLWATGATSHKIKCNKILQDTRDKNCGWFTVNKYLQSISVNNIFGSGDCICFENSNKFPPKAGVYAVREGSILVKNIIHYLNNKDKNDKDKNEFVEYDPQSDFLRLLSSGDGKAIGAKFDISFEGGWVWNYKDFIDVAWMKKFDSKTLNEKDALFFAPKLNLTKQDELNLPKLSLDMAIKYLTINDKTLIKHDKIVTEKDIHKSFVNQKRILEHMAKDKQFCNQVVTKLKQIDNENTNEDEHKE